MRVQLSFPKPAFNERLRFRARSNIFSLCLWIIHENVPTRPAFSSHTHFGGLDAYLIRGLACLLRLTLGLKSNFMRR
jgi:hypothetical protein